MTEDYKYIDHIIKEKIKNHKVEPHAKWDDLNDKLSRFEADHIYTDKTTVKYFTLKNILLSFILITIVILSIFLYVNRNKTDNDNLIHSETINIISLDAVKPVEDISDKKKVESKHIEKEKNIIIKKQVIIRDTVYL